MQIQPHDIHVWTTKLNEAPDTDRQDFALLSQDEQMRAQRFRFAIHQQRFIAAHATLRKILSLYLDIPPQEIVFNYTAEQKPYLAFPSLDLKFNLSHSADLAIFAFTLKHDIGIDIEKIDSLFNDAIADRYFNHEEQAQLRQAPIEMQTTIFYHLWSRKEALVKATGKGLRTPLSSFSVPLSNEIETIFLDEQAWSLYSLSIHPDYASAVASNQKIQAIEQWIYFNHEPQQEKIIRF